LQHLEHAEAGKQVEIGRLQAHALSNIDGAAEFLIELDDWSSHCAVPLGVADWRVASDCSQWRSESWTPSCG